MSSETIVINTTSVEETLELGRRIGAALRGGDAIGLVGQLGAGKTYLVKGIAHGLGVGDERSVNSPTFVLVNEYAGRVSIHHLDAYRLGSADELLDLGFEEMYAESTIAIVEWADRVVDAMPPNTLWIQIDAAGETNRRFHFETRDAGLLERLVAAGVDPNR
jgi:tRNA threonylcarbamoyladenosine biosynthesis protein TsaE